MKKINLGLLSLIIAAIGIVLAIIYTLSLHTTSVIWLTNHGINHVGLYPTGFFSPLTWAVGLLVGLLSLYYEKGSPTRTRLAKTSLIISIIFALLAGLCISYLLKHNFVNTKIINESPQFTQGWQTYVSDVSGFEISYPEDWYAEKCDSLYEAVLIGNSEIGSAVCGSIGPPLDSESKYDGNIGVNVYPLNEYPRNSKVVREELAGYEDPIQTKITVSNQEAVKIQGIYKNSADYKTEIIVIYKDQVFRIFNSIQTPGYSEIFDDIVATFKFTR